MMHCFSESVVKGFCSAVFTNVYKTHRRLNMDHFMMNIIEKLPWKNINGDNLENHSKNCIKNVHSWFFFFFARITSTWTEDQFRLVQMVYRKRRPKWSGPSDEIMQTEITLPQQLWHDKDPSLPKGHISAEHITRPNFCSHSPERMATLIFSRRDKK